MILGIFPSPGYYDGVGRSGLAAWQGLARDESGSILLAYGRNPPPPEILGEVRHVRSQAAAVISAISLTRSFRTTLVWHVHLLKLLPFVRRAGRIVVYLHGIEVWRRLSPSVARQLHCVDLVMSNSQYTWTRFLEWNPEFAYLPHRTVPLGLGEPALVECVPGKLPSALMIGRIERSEAYKGHHEVIGAWAAVRERVPGAELHMIGTGDLHGELRELARTHGVEDYCHLHGLVPQEPKEALLRDCRCMALPSRGEGFGLAYLESMRLGRPCLVSRSDAGREVVNPPEAGLAADPENREDLVTALSRLLTGGAEWDAMASGARRRYEALYTETAFVARLRDAVGSL